MNRNSSATRRGANRTEVIRTKRPRSRRPRPNRKAGIEQAGQPKFDRDGLDQHERFHGRRGHPFAPGNRMLSLNNKAKRPRSISR